MRKLGAMAATGAVLALALAAWTRQPPPPAQGGGTISGKVKFTGTKPVMPKIDMSEEPKCKAKYQVLTAMREPCSPLEPSQAKKAIGIARPASS